MQNGQLRKKSLSNFLLLNILVIGTSFIIAYLAASWLLDNLRGLINPVAELLPSPANNPFWILYILVYGFLSLVLLLFRYKTGSRI